MRRDGEKLTKSGKKERLDIIYEELKEIRRQQTLSTFDKIFLLLMPLALFTFSILSAYSFKLFVEEKFGFIGDTLFILFLIYPSIFIVPIVMGIKGMLNDDIGDRLRGWIYFFIGIRIVLVIPIANFTIWLLELVGVYGITQYILLFPASFPVNFVVFSILKKVDNGFISLFLRRIMPFIKQPLKVRWDKAHPLKEWVAIMAINLVWLIIVLAVFIAHRI